MSGAGTLILHNCTICTITIKDLKFSDMESVCWIESCLYCFMEKFHFPRAKCIDRIEGERQKFKEIWAFIKVSDQKVNVRKIWGESFPRMRQMWGATTVRPTIYCLFLFLLYKILADEICFATLETEFSDLRDWIYESIVLGTVRAPYLSWFSSRIGFLFKNDSGCMILISKNFNFFVLKNCATVS